MAAGIQHATLRHHSALSEHTWIKQLIDMFDVTVSFLHSNNNKLSNNYVFLGWYR